EALDRFPQRRRTAIFSAAGDRQDEAILRQAEIIGEAFDRVILYEEAEWREGRAEGELVKLLRRGMATATRAPDVLDAPKEREARALALESLRAGELLYVQASAIENTLATVWRHLDAMPPVPPSEAIDGNGMRSGHAEQAHVMLRR